MKNVKLVQELILLSIKKKDLIIKILEVTERQKRFIELGKIDTVNKQIELKDKYIKEVDKIDLIFYTMYEKLKSNLEIDSLDKIDVEEYPQVKKLKEIIGEIIDITKKIKVIDDENIAVLYKDKNNMGNKLRGIRQGKKMTNAYGAYKKPRGSLFFDKKK